MDKEDWFKKIEWPTELPDECRAELLKCCHLVTPDVHSQLRSFQNNYDKGIYYIVSGLATVSFVTLDMKPIIGGVLGCKQWFGSMIINKYPNFTLYIAEIETLTLLQFPKKKVEALCEVDPFAYKFLYGIGQENLPRWFQTQTVSFYNIEVRVVYTLLELLFCKQKEQGVIPSFSITQQQFCDVSGLSRPRVNEVFNQLKHEAIIDISRGNVRIVKIEQLYQKLHGVNLELHNPYERLINPNNN